MRWLLTGAALLCLGLALLQPWHRAPQHHVSVHRTGAGPLTLVMLGGSEGGTLSLNWLDELLAAQGFSILKLAYFDFPGGPKHLSEIDLNAIASAFPKEGCIGVLGVSKGAELALLLAAHFDLSQATVAVVPSDRVWQSSQISLLRRSSWTLNGQPLPFVPYQMFSLSGIRAALNIDTALGLHNASRMQTPGDALIPVEQITQPTLLQSAARDQVWPSQHMAQQAIERAQHSASEQALSHLSYDADHYLLAHRPALRDMITFFKTHLSRCGGETSHS